MISEKEMKEMNCEIINANPHIVSLTLDLCLDLQPKGDECTR